jgi:sodium/potassium-transporting ATPase subunit beta
VCKLDLTKFDKCQTGQAYGYNNSAPCIFLKLNRIYGWIPEYYNDSTNLPDDMPKGLKEHIISLPEAHRNQVWVSCGGESPADRDILGNADDVVEYFPSRGFPSYFYPYLNTQGYLSPLVAVKFKRPPSEFTFEIH